jgi:hypothetical protein
MGAGKSISFAASKYNSSINVCLLLWSFWKVTPFEKYHVCEVALALPVRIG